MPPERQKNSVSTVEYETNIPGNFHLKYLQVNCQLIYRIKQPIKQRSKSKSSTRSSMQANRKVFRKQYWQIRFQTESFQQRRRRVVSSNLKNLKFIS
jgi:hypothetical protein